jgi:hypothetical protein
LFITDRQSAAAYCASARNGKFDCAQDAATQAARLAWKLQHGLCCTNRVNLLIYRRFSCHEKKYFKIN